MKTIASTNRLVLREFTLQDAPFIFELLNSHTWLQFIGDRDIHGLKEAESYLETSFKSYQQNGFGFYAVIEKQLGTAIGLCGFIKRPELADVDIGFAFLPAHSGKGYGFEAATAVLAYNKNTLKIPTIIAIVNPDNVASIALIQKLGLRFEKHVLLSKDDQQLLQFTTKTEQ